MLAPSQPTGAFFRGSCGEIRANPDPPSRIRFVDPHLGFNGFGQSEFGLGEIVHLLKIEPELQAVEDGASADHIDLDAEAEILPGGVGGVDGGFALDGKGQAGAVAEREAVGAGDSYQTAGDARLIFVKRDRSAPDF